MLIFRSNQGSRRWVNARCAVDVPAPQHRPGAGRVEVLEADGAGLWDGLLLLQAAPEAAVEGEGGLRVAPAGVQRPEAPRPTRLWHL